MAASEFYEIRWGSVRMYCSRVVTMGGRSVVVHSPSQGDDHTTQDLGANVKRTRCSIEFVEMPSEAASPIDRFRTFEAQANRGDQAVFVHPVEGSMVAVVDQGWTYTIDEDNNVVDVECTFIKVASQSGVRDVQAGTSLFAGGDLVTARADELATALAAVDIDSTIATDAVAALDSWSEATETPTRQVLTDAANMQASINSLIEDHGLENDLDLWPAYIAAVQLQAAFRDAAIATTAETSSLFFMKLAAPSSVLALVVRVYGGAEAEMRERQVRSLNDLVTVGGMLEAGTELAMPTPTSSTRRAAAF